MAAGESTPRMGRSRWVWFIVPAGLILDQLTKHWAVSSLNDGRTVDVFWTLRFALGFNSGFAFSMGQGWGPVIAVVAIVASWWLIRSAIRAATVAMMLAYSLIASGAIGNLIDRVLREEGWMRGRVVDFIDLQWFPVFNVADSLITIGAVLMVGALLIQRPNPAMGEAS